MPYLLSFYVPDSHLDPVKEAIFNVGAGEFQGYRCCAWQVKGEGQYMPLEKSSPYKGHVNVLSKEIEYKVEIHCQDEVVKQAVTALKKAHPYEVPAYHVLETACF